MRDEAVGMLVAILVFMGMGVSLGAGIEACRVHIPTGTEWGTCYPNATCDSGLTCHRERCVLLPDDGDGN